MARKRLIWRLYPSYLLITLISLTAVTWIGSRTFKEFYFDDVAADLEARARLASCLIAPEIADGNSNAVADLCRECGEASATRITVIGPDGIVLGDSRKEPVAMDNHADRPEIREAFAGRTGTATRFSYTLDQNMMYVAVPVEAKGRIAAVVRSSLSLASVKGALGNLYTNIVLWGLAIAILAAAISLAVSRYISRPLEEMRQGAERFAGGDLKHRLEVPDSLEIGSLAQALNTMADRLDERIRLVLEKRNEQNAILTSMTEGVLAVDCDERLININRAAGRMLEIDPSEMNGRTIQEAVRNTELQRFVSRALKSREPIESEILLGDTRDRLVNAHGTVLLGEGEMRIGALVVLNDITRLRKLENLRREFVANVSHELKTPITSIKGSVETLVDGAVNDPEDADRFLEIIGRHADRLSAIVDDLLSLSRIELESERNEIALEDAPVRNVLEAVVRSCRELGSAGGIELVVECVESLRARINTPLLEHAVINLVDNAIKSSQPGSAVRIIAEASEGGIAISVSDRGCGIADEHLPRLFERFYRADKVRSRELGGTGLGLAIAKHITQGHGGRISVRSRPGEGSVFTILLPA